MNADQLPTASTEARFDALARACHEASLQRLSPRTQARLAQARRPASGIRAPRLAWALPAAFAAVAVLAIAVQLRQPPTGAPTGQAPAVVAASTDGATNDPATTLDENPDFYLWLASNDAVMPSTPEY